MSSDEPAVEVPSNLQSILRYLRTQSVPKRPKRRRTKLPVGKVSWDAILDGRTHIFPYVYEGSPWNSVGALRAACYREAASRALVVETHLYGEAHFEVKAAAAWEPGTMLGDLAPPLYHDDGPIWWPIPGREGEWHPDRGPDTRLSPQQPPSPQRQVWDDEAMRGPAVD